MAFAIWVAVGVALVVVTAFAVVVIIALMRGGLFEELE